MTLLDNTCATPCLPWCVPTGVGDPSRVGPSIPSEATIILLMSRIAMAHGSVKFQLGLVQLSEPLYSHTATRWSSGIAPMKWPSLVGVQGLSMLLPLVWPTPFKG